jgi:glycosyltransferase involved in cell wall biosynthesis
MPAPGKSLSIIVPAFNESKLIRETLRTIKAAARAFTANGWTIQLVVCDNNSTDETAAIAREEGAATVFEPNNQIARARNTGSAAAIGDWFLFVDADSRPSPELFNELRLVLESGRVCGGGCIVRMDERHFLGDLLTKMWNTVSRVNKWAAGSFVYCEATAFKSIGGFSLELYAGEEIEFSKALKKYARAQSKKVAILHRHPLLTSARKLHLYSRKELLRLIAKVVLRPRSSQRNKEICHAWYDGRR